MAAGLTVAQVEEALRNGISAPSANDTDSAANRERTIRENINTWTEWTRTHFTPEEFDIYWRYALDVRGIDPTVYGFDKPQIGDLQTFVRLNGELPTWLVVLTRSDLS